MSETIRTYDQNSREFAERYEKALPKKIHELALAFFSEGAKTVDIGCGSGRDVAFLKSKGFDAEGVDVSEGMLSEARRIHPDCVFHKDTLPDLAGLESGTYANLLCNAVLMHLPEAEIVKGLLNLLRVLEVKGRAVISFRGPGNVEEDAGRLFTKITANQAAELLESLGGKVLYLDENRDGEKTWHTIVAEKTGVEKRDGVSKIQEIITNDNKTATYKLALLRSLCDLARSESHTVLWDPELDFVIVPLERLALSWLRYYWEPIRRGVKQTTSRNLAFSASVEALFKEFSNPRDAILNYESTKPNPLVVRAVRNIAQTINDQPVKYAGGGKTPVFVQRGAFSIEWTDSWRAKWYGLKGIKVPAGMWRDIRRFHHWIEKSLIVEWVEMTSEKLDRARNPAEIFKMIYNVDYADKRTTDRARRILERQDLYCVWTGKKLSSSFHVDHVIPYGLWRNNDWWNLLPASSKVNLDKKMLLPHPEHIRKRADLIVGYWELYQTEFGAQFERQVERALGRAGDRFSLSGTVDQLILVATQLHNSRGVEYYTEGNQ